MDSDNSDKIWIIPDFPDVQPDPGPKQADYRLCDFNEHGMYQTILGQVIGVFLTRRNTHVIRLWDGTKFGLQTPNKVDLSSEVENLFTMDENLNKLLPEEYVVDIFVYEEHIPKALELKAGDLVKVGNLHAYFIDNFRQVSLTLHHETKKCAERNYGRGIWKLPFDCGAYSRLQRRLKAALNQLVPESQADSKNSTIFVDCDQTNGTNDIPSNNNGNNDILVPRHHQNDGETNPGRSNADKRHRNRSESPSNDISAKNGNNDILVPGRSDPDNQQNRPESQSSDESFVTALDLEIPPHIDRFFDRIIQSVVNEYKQNVNKSSQNVDESKQNVNKKFKK